MHVHFRRSAHTLDAGRAAARARAAVLRRPATSCSAGWWARRVVLVLQPRPAARCASSFNLGQIARRPRGSPPRSSTRSRRPAADSARRVWSAALLAVLVAAGRRRCVLVGAAMWLLGRRHRAAQARRDGRRWRSAVAAINTSLGLAAGTVVETDPRAAILLLAPALAVFLAYRAHIAERRQTRQPRVPPRGEPHAARRAADAAPALAGCSRWRSRLPRRGRRGLPVPRRGEGEGSRITRRRAPRGLEVMQPLDAAVVDELRELIGARPAARLVTPEEVGGALAAHLRRLGVERGDARPAAGRAALARHDDDRQPHRPRRRASAATTCELFDTLARQTGAALGQDRLTHKVDELRDAAGPPRAPGVPRPAHRARQPAAVHGPRRARAPAPQRQRGRALRRPRRLQADQRHATATRPATRC